MKRNFFGCIIENLNVLESLLSSINIPDKARKDIHDHLKLWLRLIGKNVRLNCDVPQMFADETILRGVDMELVAFFLFVVRDQCENKTPPVVVLIFPERWLVD